MLFNLLKSVLMGLVQGITEWLPVSSGGHLLLLNTFLPLEGVTEEFWNLYDVVIQLGSILAVVVLYFHRLNPFAPSKTRAEKRDTWALWFRIIVAVIPSGIHRRIRVLPSGSTNASFCTPPIPMNRLTSPKL